MLRFSFTEELPSHPIDKDGPLVVTRWGKARCGDPLYRNDIRPGYGYHDGIHMGIYIYTGCSIIVQSFTEKKKPLPKYALLEENIAREIFFNALKNNFYKNSVPSKKVLKKIKEMTVDSPWENNSNAEWSDCIVKTCPMINQLIENRGGIVEIDPQKKLMQYKLTA